MVLSEGVKEEVEEAEVKVLQVIEIFASAWKCVKKISIHDTKVLSISQLRFIVSK